jgi:hypothetical protein
MFTVRLTREVDPLMGPQGVRAMGHPPQILSPGQTLAGQVTRRGVARDPAPLRYVGVRPIDRTPVDGPPSSAHSGRNRGGRTNRPALRAGRAIARNLRNPTCGCAAIPHFHMTLSPDDQLGQQRRFWCYHPMAQAWRVRGSGGPAAPRDSGCGGDPTGDASQSWRPRGVAPTASTARSASPKSLLDHRVC